MLRRFTPVNCSAISSSSSSCFPRWSPLPLLHKTSASSTRSCSTTSSTDFIHVTGSNTHIPTQPISVSQTTFSDIVGENASSSITLARPERIAAGDLLALTDACAAQSAAGHVFGRNYKRLGNDDEPEKDNNTSSKKKKPTSVTTVAFQEIVLSVPIMSGDFMKLTGEVVNVGASSLDVHVSVEKLQFPTVPGDRTETHVADAYASFVSIGEDLRPVKAVPPLGHENESSIKKGKRAMHLKELNNMRLGEEKLTRKLSLQACRETTEQMKLEIHDLFKGTIHESSSPLLSSSSAPAKVSMKNATLEAHRFFLQGYQNMHSTIFGGEILKWMEKHALYSARRFAVNPEVHTLAMHSVGFHEPIFFTDAVSLRARVVNVRNTTMEVDVEVFVDRADGRHLTSNCASFVLVNLSNYGKPRPIGIELDMTDASHEEYIAHVNAMKRYLRLAKCRDYTHERKK